MKYRIHQSKSSIFLMELIIVILFFSLTGAVCLQIFIKARAISHRSKELTHAVMWAENITEIYLGCEGDAGNFAAVLNREYGLNAAFKSGDHTDAYDFYLDDSWAVTDEAGAYFKVSVSLDNTSSMHTGETNIYALQSEVRDPSDPIYALSFRKYIPMTVSLEGGNP